MQSSVFNPCPLHQGAQLRGTRHQAVHTQKRTVRGSRVAAHSGGRNAQPSTTAHVLASLDEHESQRLVGTQLEALLPSSTQHPGNVDEDQLERIQERLDRNADFLHGKQLNVRALLVREPRLFCTNLPEFQEFMLASGFSPEGVVYLLGQAPEAVSKASLFTIGRTLLQLKAMGMPAEMGRQMLLVYPQLMYMEEQEVVGLVRLVAKFSGSIGAC